MGSASFLQPIISPRGLYHADGHYFVVGTGGFPSDGTSSSQVFHPKPVVLPNDVQEDIPVGKVEPWCGKHLPA